MFSSHFLFLSYICPVFSWLVYPPVDDRWRSFPQFEMCNQPDEPNMKGSDVRICMSVKDDALPH